MKAKTAEGRFTGYILVAFPAVMFLLSYFMNPGYAGILLPTRRPHPARHRGRAADAGAVRDPEDHDGEGVRLEV